MCDFLDDDGNGQVDEGFPWVISEWKTIYTLDTTHFANPRDVVVADNRVLVALGDEYGNGTDRIGLVSLDRQGELIRDPVWTAVPSGGLDAAYLAVGRGVSALFYGSTDYGTCAGGGCPIYHRLFRVDNDEPVSQGVRVKSPADINNVLRNVQFSGDAFVLSVDTQGDSYLLWLDASTGVSSSGYICTGDIDEERGIAFHAQNGNAGIGPCIRATSTGLVYQFQRDATPDSIEFGVLPTYGRDPELGSNNNVVPGFLLSNFTPYMGLLAPPEPGVGNSILVQYNEQQASDGSLDQAQWQVVKISLDSGTVTDGPRTIGQTGDTARDVVPIAGGLNWLVVGESTKDGLFLERLVRLDSTLHEIAPVGGVETFSRGAGARLVALDDHVLVIRGSGSLLQVATIGCK